MNPSALSALRAPGGQDQFFAFIEFMQNPAKIKAEVEKIDKARKAANTAIAKAGKASEIERLHASATAALVDADKD
ncbi:MAG: hypothetical protein QF797_19805, partial [Alphaproteobacteria bacterium]|nr:hypothetical protein [Alphaproteobacteria bacterium]